MSWAALDLAGDGAFGVVSDPAGEGVSACGVSGGGAEADVLNAAREHELEPGQVGHIGTSGGRSLAREPRGGAEKRAECADWLPNPDPVLPSGEKRGPLHPSRPAQADLLAAGGHPTNERPRESERRRAPGVGRG